MKRLKLTDPETKYAIPPEGCEKCKLYLTIGKKYKIHNIRKIGKFNTFCIINDMGDSTFCKEKECNHLGRKDWIFSS